MPSFTEQQYAMIKKAGFKGYPNGCFNAPNWSLTLKGMGHLIQNHPDPEDLPAYILGSDAAIKYLVAMITRKELWVGTGDPDHHNEKGNMGAANLLLKVVAPLWEQMLMQEGTL